MIGTEGIGGLLREIRVRDGRTQEEQTAALAQVCGRAVDSKTWHRWERGTRIPTKYWHGFLSTLCGIPESEILRAVQFSRRQRTLMKQFHDSQESDDVKRRTFVKGLGTAVIAAGATAEPWGRLAAAISPPKVDAKLVGSLAQRTIELHDLGQKNPSYLVMPVVTAHLDHLTTVLPIAGKFRRDVAIAASGTAALAGYTSYDLGNNALAQTYCDVAKHAAQEAGHPALLANIQAHLSYMLPADESRKVLAAAQQYTKGPGLATASSWLSAMEAENAAVMGDRIGAIRSLERATTAYEYARPREDQLWTEFFTPSRLEARRIAVLGELNDPELHEVADSALARVESASDRERALVLASTARAYLRAGYLDRAEELALSAVQANGDNSKFISGKVAEIGGMILDKDPSKAALAEELGYAAA